MICITDKELLLCLKVLVMLDNGFKIKNKEKEYINGLIKMFMKEIGLTEKEMAKENIIGKMETFILDNGKMI